MRKPVLAIAMVAVTSVALAACGGGSGGGGGGGGKTLVISSDLPLQGSSKDASDAANKAIQLYLSQQNNKAGDYTIQFKQYDDSTAAAGQWDAGKCTTNATAHVNNKQEVAVMGTYNSGCAKIEVPILDQDPSGPMVMVSHANTNPGLTKPWESGEPQKYYPKGTRNYARVITTDDYQGFGAAAFASKTLKVKTVYVLNDNQTYGQGVAKAFQDNAVKDGIQVVGSEAWDGKATNYTALMQKIQATGADAVYLGGIYDNNGGQLVKDKVAVLGDNTKIKLLAPDGFSGYPDLDKLPQAEGMYLSFAGLTTTQLRANGGAGAKLLDAYKAKYGADPSSNYALYAVAAVQVILAAIAQSDGTRKGVQKAIFGGSGITIAATDAVLGKEIKIDPQTGDTSAKDISIEVLKGGVETFVSAQSIS